MNGSRETDESVIIAHIRGLFEAYLRRDRPAIRRGHTADWRGFHLRSEGIVRGIDEYMKAADQVLASVRAVRYELLDVDVQVHGDLAIVLYLAREWLAGEGGKETTIRLRALDVYRREAEGWNQCGSNILVTPEAGGG